MHESDGIDFVHVFRACWRVGVFLCWCVVVTAYRSCSRVVMLECVGDWRFCGLSNAHFAIDSEEQPSSSTGGSMPDISREFTGYSPECCRKFAGKSATNSADKRRIFAGT